MNLHALFLVLGLLFASTPSFADDELIGKIHELSSQIESRLESTLGEFKLIRSSFPLEKCGMVGDASHNLASHNLLSLLRVLETVSNSSALFYVHSKNKLAELVIEAISTVVLDDSMNVARARFCGLASDKCGVFSADLREGICPK